MRSGPELYLYAYQLSQRLLRGRSVQTRHREHCLRHRWRNLRFLSRRTGMRTRSELYLYTGKLFQRLLRRGSVQAGYREHCLWYRRDHLCQLPSRT